VLAFQNGSNGRAPNLKTQFEQFALEFARAPPWVLSGQAYDQRFEFRRDPRPAYSWLALKSPLAAHELPMPPQHGFRREQNEALTEQSARVLGPMDEFRDEKNQRQFLPPGEAWWAGLFPLQDAKLIPQQEDLQIFFAIRPSA
jgi:hypothetical protein